MAPRDVSPPHLQLAAASARLRSRSGRPRTRPTKPETPPLSPRLLDIEAAAAYLGLSRWTVQNLLDAGTLRRVAVPIGAKDVRRVLFDRQDLDALVEQWKT